MQHKLELILQTEAHVEWECPVCQRHIQMNAKGGGLKILNPGDQMVNHGSASTTPELSLDQAIIEKKTIH